MWRSQEDCVIAFYFVTWYSAEFTIIFIPFLFLLKFLLLLVVFKKIQNLKWRGRGREIAQMTITYCLTSRTPFSSPSYRAAPLHPLGIESSGPATEIQHRN